MSDRARVLRVLQVHTRYRLAGGEDRAVEAERRLLEQAGITVQQVIFDNAELSESRSVRGDMQLAAAAVWSRSAVRRIQAAVGQQPPDVIHVHNTFAAASPSVLRAGSGLGVPVIHTLHNYRVVCPAATLFRNGRICIDCMSVPAPLPAVLHRCVRGSRSQSMVAATTQAVHRGLGTYTRHVARFIALTEFQRALVTSVLPNDAVTVLPNFLEPDPGPGSSTRSGILFAGRLSAEKGIATLVEAAELAPGILSVAGDGPLAGVVKAAHAAGSLAYLGSLEAGDLLAAMKGSLALVVPSVWFEGFPIVVLQALATGTPVIASNIGSLAEIVEDQVTALLVKPGDGAELATAFNWATGHAKQMGAMGDRARDTYERLYRGPSHLAGLLAVYEAAISERRPPGEGAG